MDLKRLAHVVALADERHFGRAAERVHLSQPAFSRSIQAAESALGLALFDRGGTEVVCTDAGRFVVERARRLLFDHRCLERDVKLYREQQIGDLAIGVGPFPATTLMPQLVSALRNRYPGVSTRVEVNNWQYLLEHLRAEELDFFVADIRDVPVQAELQIRALARQIAHFYVRSGHPLLERPSLRPPDLVPWGLASVRVPGSIRELLRQLFGLPAHATLPLALECDDVTLLKIVTLASDTVLASTNAAVEQELAAGTLVALPLTGMPPMFADMGIVSLAGRSDSPMAAFAVGFLLELVAQQRQPGA